MKSEKKNKTSITTNKAAKKVITRNYNGEPLKPGEVLETVQRRIKRISGAALASEIFMILYNLTVTIPFNDLLHILTILLYLLTITH